MTEAWRIKTYYSKRVLVDTLGILDSQFPDVLLCLTGAQADMLRNMTQYLHRRSTFAQEYTKTHYSAPSNADWETISALVANLEDKLMGCDIDAIVTAIEANTQAIADMSVCVCALSSQAAETTPQSVLDNGTALQPTLAEETGIAAIGVPVTDTLKCDLANVIFGFTFEWITESLLPLANQLGDATTVMITATTGFAVLTGGLGLAPALVVAGFTAVVRYLFDQATSNIINWMLGNAQEIVCELYNGLSAGGFNQAMLNMTDYIDSSGLPLGDRMMLKLTLTSTWFMRAMQYQIDNLGIDPDDYTNYLCNVCDTPAEYTWSGVCITNEIIHDICRDGFVALDVGRTLQTATSFVEASTFDIEVLISNRMRQGFGGVFQVSLLRWPSLQSVRTANFTTDTVDWETDTINWTSVQSDEYVIRIVPLSGDKVCGVQWINANTT